MAKKATPKKKAAPAKKAPVKAQPETSEPDVETPEPSMLKAPGSEPKAPETPKAEGADPAPEEFEKLFAPAEPVKTREPMSMSPGDFREKLVDDFFATCKGSGMKRGDVNMVFNILNSALPIMRRRWHKEFPSASG